MKSFRNIVGATLAVVLFKGGPARGIRTIVFIIGCLLFSQCKSDDDMTGKVQIEFVHQFGNQPFLLDTVTYLSPLNDTLRFHGLKYFVSEVILKRFNGDYYAFNTIDNIIHYVDVQRPYTLNWNINQELPMGVYDSIIFVFGLKTDKNTNGRFPNPPENAMEWPIPMGGGYHFMMLDGQWRYETDTAFQGFGMHLGNLNGMDNHIEFRLRKKIDIKQNQTTKVTLTMDVKEWFENPHTWDFRQFGGAIMADSIAQQTLKDNGYNVFK